MNVLLIATWAVLLRAATIGAGLIFVTAGLQKWRHRDILPGIVANYRLLPDRTVSLVAGLLPIVECIIGVALLLGIGALPGLAGGGLLLVFAAAMAINLMRGRNDIHCGCGRTDLRHGLRWSAVARNLVLASLLFASMGAPAIGNVMGLASAIFTGIALWTAYVLMETIGMLETSAALLRRRH